MAKKDKDKEKKAAAAKKEAEEKAAAAAAAAAKENENAEDPKPEKGLDRLFWIYPVLDDGTANPKTAYGFIMEPTKEGFYSALMGKAAAAAELKRKNERTFIDKKDYDFIVKANSSKPEKSENE